MIRPVLFVSVFALLTSAAVAHHGWGSYDANKPITVAGPAGNLTVNDASVLCGGVQTANATVYLIDTVLMPPAA